MFVDRLFEPMSYVVFTYCKLKIAFSSKLFFLVLRNGTLEKKQDKDNCFIFLYKTSWLNDKNSYQTEHNNQISLTGKRNTMYPIKKIPIYICLGRPRSGSAQIESNTTNYVWFYFYNFFSISPPWQHLKKNMLQTISNIFSFGIELNSVAWDVIHFFYFFVNTRY